MLNRELKVKLLEMVSKMPIVGLVGPRQSGKTTLLKNTFSDYSYVSLENWDNREFATKDPRSFLEQYSERVIFDEIQNAPKLFSYLQEIVDSKQQAGQFIISGSQHFLLMEKISQTLAGRIALLTLLPFSIAELQNTNSLSPNSGLEKLIFTGAYPRLYNSSLQPQDWYPDYIQTYIERDVRQLKNVHDLNTFQKFLKMCASRVGQLLNLSSLANDCGITHNTAKSWISLLETCFILFLLPPHHKNFGKRLIKNSKLYFYDTGVVCSLLGINEASQIATHYARGALFENLIIADLMKKYYNRGQRPPLYFWRDLSGHEIDCIIENGDELIPIEIKSSKTIADDYFHNLNYWQKLQNKETYCYIIYGGTATQKRSAAHVLPWNAIPDFTSIIKKRNLCT